MGSVEPGLREPAAAAAAAAVRAVCVRRLAGSLLQHVRPDLEPAGLWNRVSFSFPSKKAQIKRMMSLLTCLASACLQAVAVFGLDGEFWIFFSPGSRSSWRRAAQHGELQHGRISVAVRRCAAERQQLSASCRGEKRAGPCTQRLRSQKLLLNYQFSFCLRDIHLQIQNSTFSVENSGSFYGKMLLTFRIKAKR